jgi:hypothetical protein
LVATKTESSVVEPSSTVFGWKDNSTKGLANTGAKFTR